MHYERRGPRPDNGGARPRYEQQPDQRRRSGGQVSRHGQSRPGPRKPPRPKLPKKESKIYFIALLPNAAVGKEIIRLRQEFADQYDARKALRVLPYITVQVPFTADPAIEKELCEGLSDFAVGRAPFEIRLDGFGGLSFSNRRLLFFNVIRDAEIMQLHRELIIALRKDFGFSSMLARYGFNPHISLALNDLTDEGFAAAREEYAQKDFKASFTVNNLYLLRHTGTDWEVLHKCRLGGA